MTWPEDITPEPSEAVEELKRRIINDVTPKMLEDETIYYRFLKARDFKLEDAEDMLRKHIVWRKEYGIDTLLKDYEPPEVAVKYMCTNFIGYDKEGSPVRFMDTGSSDFVGMLNSMKRLDLIKCNFYILEQDEERLKMQSIKLGRPVTKLVIIHNFANFTFAKATNKRCLEFSKELTEMFQDNYPERIKRVVVCNASIYFTIIYSLVKSVIPRALIEKFRIFGADGWKEYLLELIDADQLPVFLGGTRTDPDGDPSCRTFITYGQKIPKCYYLSETKRRISILPGVKTLKVAPFSKADIKFEVDEPDSLLEWEFDTKSKDIGFGVYFKKKSSDSKAVEMMPKQRIDPSLEPEAGLLKCEETGTYTIVFDNSYSWIYSKEIHYIARIVEPSEVKDDA